MGKAIAQFQVMLGWMEDLPKLRVIASQKLRTLRQCDLEHKRPQIPKHNPNEPVTVPCSLSLNQVDLLLALGLFGRQICKFIQGAQVRAGRSRNDVGIGPVP